MCQVGVVLLLSHCHCVTHNANCEPPPIRDMFYLPQDRFMILTVHEKYVRDQRREMKKKTFINILHPSSLTKRAILMKWWMYCLTQEGNDSCYVITWTNHTTVYKETNFTRASLSPLFSPWSYRRLFVFEFLCPYNLYTPMVESALKEFHSLTHHQYVLQYFTSHTNFHIS